MKNRIGRIREIPQNIEVIGRQLRTVEHSTQAEGKLREIEIEIVGLRGGPELWET